MTIAERQAIADATEACRALTIALADLTKRVGELEDAATRPINPNPAGRRNTGPGPHG